MLRRFVCLPPLPPLPPPASPTAAAAEWFMADWLTADWLMADWLMIAELAPTAAAARPPLPAVCHCPSTSLPSPCAPPPSYNAGERCDGARCVNHCLRKIDNAQLLMRPGDSLTSIQRKHEINKLLIRNPNKFQNYCQSGPERCLRDPNHAFKELLMVG